MTWRSCLMSKIVSPSLNLRGPQSEPSTAREASWMADRKGRLQVRMECNGPPRPDRAMFSGLGLLLVSPTVSVLCTDVTEDADGLVAELEAELAGEIERVTLRPLCVFACRAPRSPGPMAGGSDGGSSSSSASDAELEPAPGEVSVGSVVHCGRCLEVCRLALTAARLQVPQWRPHQLQRKRRRGTGRPLLRRPRPPLRLLRPNLSGLLAAVLSCVWGYAGRGL